MSFSPAALRAMFSPDADESLIVLLTLYGGGLSAPVRIANGWTERLSETSEEVVYGVRSRSKEFVFLPFNISLPTDSGSSAPAATVTMYDISHEVVPELRNLSSPPSATMELVLPSSPDLLEASFTGFQMGAFSYDADSVSAGLALQDLSGEPFPAHCFTPSTFPGLF